MKSNATAKHMELYAKLKGLFEVRATEGSVELEGGWAIRVGTEIQREARKYLREHGYGGAYDREEIIGILQYLKRRGLDR